MATIKPRHKYYWACLGPIECSCTCSQPIATQQSKAMGCSSRKMVQFPIGNIGHTFWKHALLCSSLIEGLRGTHQVLASISMTLLYIYLHSHLISSNMWFRTLLTVIWVLHDALSYSIACVIDSWLMTNKAVRYFCPLLYVDVIIIVVIAIVITMSCVHGWAYLG